MSTLTSATFVEAWRHAGLSEALPELIEAHRATMARINAEARAAAAAVEQARRGRAEHIAEGRSGKFPVLPDPVDFDNARMIAEKTFMRQARALGDSLVAELHEACAELLAEATELVPAIGDLQTDAQAVARTTTAEAREAWSRLGALWRDRRELLLLLTELRHSDVIPDAPTHAEAAALANFRLFARPNAGRASGSTFILAGHNSTPDALQMAKLIRESDERGPGIYTLAEARAHKAAAEREQIAEARLQAGGAGVSDPHRAAEIKRQRQAGLIPPTVTLIPSRR